MQKRRLIFDTSTNDAFLALAQGKELLVHIPLQGGEGLHLPFEIQALLNAHPGPIDSLLAGHGPGSLTGTRVGLTCAKTLSFAWDIPYFTFCSLSSYDQSHPIVVNGHSRGLHILHNQELLTLPLTEAKLLLEPHPTLFTPHPKELQTRLPEFPWTRAIRNLLPLLTETNETAL